MRWVEDGATGARIQVYVQPRAKRNEVVGRHGGALKVRLQAGPVEGAANEALVEFLAERLEVPQAAVEILAGQWVRSKLVVVRGLTAAQVKRALCPTAPKKRKKPKKPKK